MKSIVYGRLRRERGPGVAGALVQLRDPRTGDLLAVSPTSADGKYRATVTTGAAIEVELRVIDGRGEPLAELQRLALEAGATVEFDVAVAAESLREFEPVGRPLTPPVGRLIPQDALHTIETAIRGTWFNGEVDRYMVAARDALPPLGRFSNVVEDAWRVLKGDAQAAGRFRLTLLALRATAPGDRDPFGVIGQPNLPCEEVPDVDGEPVVPLDALVLTTVAALRAATSEENAVDLLIGLEAGLAGLTRFEDLVEAARLALVGNDALLRDAVQRLQYPLPPPPPWPPPGVPCFVIPGQELWRELCLKMICLHGVNGQPPRAPITGAPGYTITSITPVDACPGLPVTIRGTNFGSVPGSVLFPDNVVEGATFWSDQEVRAVVPDDARGGMLRLLILDDIRIECRRIIELYRAGTGATFSGGAPLLYGVTINGSAEVVAPGAPMAVSWKASPPGNVSLRMQIYIGGSLEVEVSNLPAAGSFTFTPPTTPVRPTRVEAVATATNACGSDTRSHITWIDVVPTLTIEGFEITQGIQTFWRSGVQDNSLATVANKDTIVRVYVSANRAGFYNDEVDNVAVILRVDGVELWPINGTTPTNPYGATPLLKARSRLGIRRSETDHTFNFRVPAYLCNGTKQLFAYAIAGVSGGRVVVTASLLMSWMWHALPVVPIRWIRVRDTRPAPAGTGTIPTEDQARFTVQRAVDLLPVAPTDIAPHPTRAVYPTTHDFSTNVGGPDLWRELNQLYSDDHPGLVHQAAVPEERWIALTVPWNRGFADGYACIAPVYTVATGQTWNRRRAAHELGHSLTLAHNDTTLQDVPFDPFWNKAVTGGTVYDLMSYKSPNWTSEASWNFVQNYVQQ